MQENLCRKRSDIGHPKRHELLKPPKDGWGSAKLRALNNLVPTDALALFALQLTSGHLNMVDHGAKEGPAEADIARRDVLRVDFLARLEKFCKLMSIALPSSFGDT